MVTNKTCLILPICANDRRHIFPRKMHMVGKISINTLIVTQSLDRTITKHDNEDFSPSPIFQTTKSTLQNILYHGSLGN